MIRSILVPGVGFLVPTVTAAHDLVLDFANAGQLRHTIVTSDGSAYTATYPDGTVATVASGTERVHTLPAGTDGAVGVTFADGATRSALRLGGGAWTHVDGVPLWTPAGKSWVVAAYDYTGPAGISVIGGKLAGADDSSGNARHASQPDASRRAPWYGADPRARGLPAADVDESSPIGRAGLLTPSFTARRAYIGAGYRDGTQGVFPDHVFLLGGPGSQGTRRILANNGNRNEWQQGGGFTFSSHSRVNGAPSDLSPLPLPLSVLTFDAGTNVTQAYRLGHTTHESNPDRTWQGPQTGYVFTTGAESDADRDRLEGWRAHRDATLLVAGHPYRDTPPMAA